MRSWCQGLMVAGYSWKEKGQFQMSGWIQVGKVSPELKEHPLLRTAPAEPCGYDLVWDTKFGNINISFHVRQALKFPPMWWRSHPNCQRACRGTWHPLKHNFLGKFSTPPLYLPHMRTPTFRNPHIGGGHQQNLPSEMCDSYSAVQQALCFQDLAGHWLFCQGSLHRERKWKGMQTCSGLDVKGIWRTNMRPQHVPVEVQ